MKIKTYAIALIPVAMLSLTLSFNPSSDPPAYEKLYYVETAVLKSELEKLHNLVRISDPRRDAEKIKLLIAATRRQLKKTDFWLRYLDPVSYKRINGPLPVEWETEVFEKFEPPYRREGGGLSLARMYLGEENAAQDSLVALVGSAMRGLDAFHADTTVSALASYHHFFLCNRLYILNLASIYTSGFECPDQALIIPELKNIMQDVRHIYSAYNASFPEKPLSSSFLSLYDQTVAFVLAEPVSNESFNHFAFIRDYVNPLFELNQQHIRDYRVISDNFNDYTLSGGSNSIFSKSLFRGQAIQGVYYRVKDPKTLNEIRQTGRLLFYDPLLSGNNMRSCASCHKPDEYFTDTIATSPLNMNRTDRLDRNTPSLINSIYHHLLMLDGKHISLHSQAKDVMQNSAEMGSSEKEIMEKILSCREYKKAFTDFLPYVKPEKQITINQVISAIILYYSEFSNYDASFDDAMNKKAQLNQDAINGFNLFMGKAQCGTCHFPPQFNGSKPPYISSEFEVLGVPANKEFTMASADSGRFLSNPAPEMLNAFRTPGLRNISHTAPYGHNGIFRSLLEIIDFYDAGGGTGKGLKIYNQTLPGDSLHLTAEEKNALVVFMKSLDEKIIFDTPPSVLPVSTNKVLNSRKPGGVY